MPCGGEGKGRIGERIGERRGASGGGVAVASARWGTLWVEAVVAFLVPKGVVQDVHSLLLGLERLQRGTSTASLLGETFEALDALLAPGAEGPRDLAELGRRMAPQQRVSEMEHRRIRRY
jgi:hypothetical protein